MKNAFSQKPITGGLLADKNGLPRMGKEGRFE
jgi:hypothetical protein